MTQAIAKSATIALINVCCEVRSLFIGCAIAPVEASLIHVIVRVRSLFIGCAIAPVQASLVHVIVRVRSLFVQSSHWQGGHG